MSGTPAEHPSGHERETPEPTPPPMPGRGRGGRAGLAGVAWPLPALAGTGAVAVARAVPDLPPWISSAGAVTVTSAYALGLAVRTGWHPVLATSLAVALAGAAVTTARPVLLSAAAVSTAVLGAVLGVLVTVPAVRMRVVARECLVAVAVAAMAGLAADGYGADVSVVRAGYLVLGLSLAGALLLARRLAAGLHGLGRRGAAMVVAGITLLAVSLAYTEALSRWGSPELVDAVERRVVGLRGLLGAVPRPTVFLLGIPALAWGVSTRARRRQGWWGTGFGAAGLAVVATSVLEPVVSPAEAALATAYALAVGLALGYLVIRADGFLSGTRGRGARRLEEASANRPEPGRTEPLL